MILGGPVGRRGGLIVSHFGTIQSVFTSVIRVILGKISTFLGGLLSVVSFAAKMPGPLGAPFRRWSGR